MVGWLPRSRPALSLLPLLALSGAWAAPDPVLGPSGLVELGPYTPTSPPLERARRGLVQVDPETGALWLEQVDVRVTGSGPALELRRVWRDGAWHFNLEDRLEVSDTGVTLDFDRERVWLAPFAQAEQAVNELATGWLPGSRFGDRGELQRTEAGWELRLGDELRRFDAEGRLLEREDAYGNRQVYVYDVLGLTRVEQDGRWIKVLRDTSGRPSAIAAPGGQEHFYRNRDGLLKVSLDPQGRQLRYAYDELGRPRMLLWPDGSTLRVSYDDQSRVTAMSSSDGWLQRYLWRTDGLNVNGPGSQAWTIELGAQERTVWDASGRRLRCLYEDGLLVAWIDAAGGRTSVRRDEQGRITEVQSPDGRRWRLDWDQLGLRALGDPAGATWRVRRDPQGGAVGVSEPGGRELEYRRDGQGRLKSVGPRNHTVELKRNADGQVVAIQQPLGGTTRLDRDGRGRVVEVVDPSGASILLQAFDGLLPGALVDRARNTWTLDRDSLGRILSIELDGQELARFDRSGGGRLRRIRAGLRDLQLRYDTNTRFIQLVDSLGGTWSVLRDSSGRVSALRGPEGSELSFGWSTLDRLVSLDGQELKRDTWGNPVRLGPTSWTWDSRGALLSVSSGAVDLGLERDASGDLSRVRIGEASFEVQRDGAGRLVGLGDLRLDRDSGGRLTALRSSGTDLSIERDERGLPFRIKDGQGRVWRGLYDAQGQLTRWTAPDGTSISAQRDEQGRVTMVRYPDGSLSRTDRSPDLRGSVIEDASGRVLLDRRETLDANGLTVRVDERARTEDSLTHHRDARGELVVLEGELGAWSWTPDGVEAPDGSVASLDEEGRPTTATPPVGPAAWGAGFQILSYDLDELGCITTVVGELGLATVEYDALGRPLRFSSPELTEPLELGWDLLGRLVHLDGEQSVELTWGPLGLLTRGDLPLIHVHGWGLSETGRTPMVIATDATATPRALLQAGELWDWLEWTPLGFPTGGTSTWLGPSEALALLPGGPFVDSAGLYDPISGTRSCAPNTGLQPWPSLEGSSEPWWDPQRWQADELWSQPLDVLLLLGELEPVVEGPWVQLRPTEAELPWLPRSSLRPQLSLLPPADALPLELDPVTAHAVSAALPTVHPVRFEDLARAAVQDELNEPWLDLLDPPAPTWLFKDPR